MNETKEPEKKKPSKFQKDIRGILFRMRIIKNRIFSYPVLFLREFLVNPLKRENAPIRPGKHFGGVKLAKTPMWEQTEDAQGHRPSFNVRCHFCDCPMALRHSVIFVGRNDDNEANARNINQMSYKCPKCAWFVRFMVIDDTKYLRKVKNKYRFGLMPFLPTVDDWSEENEEIGRQLKALGYWAGR